jgi:hypothetical protein
MMPFVLALVAALAALGAPSAPTDPYPGAEAPLLEVDRFSDAAATLLRRSVVPGLPGPNEPFRLDRPEFLIQLSAAGGVQTRCYDLDVRPATPARLYVFYDEAGNYKLGQFPVVDVAPGDPGYTDLWDVWKVTVPPGFRINSLRDRDSVEKLLASQASGYAAARTGVLVNGPIVPEGTTAEMKSGGGGRAARLYFWYKGRRAPYLYFEGSILAQGALAPVSEMTFMSGKPPAGEAIVAALPRQQGYSPLRRVLGPDGKPLLDGCLNCPVVGD